MSNYSPTHLLVKKSNSLNQYPYQKKKCYDGKCIDVNYQREEGFPFSDHSWAFALSTEPVVRNRQAGVVPIKRVDYSSVNIYGECENEFTAKFQAPCSTFGNITCCSKPGGQRIVPKTKKKYIGVTIQP